MCQTYLDAIRDQALGAFDTWSDSTGNAAEAFGNVLNELFAPQNGGSCAPSPANPGAIVLTPLPSAHYQVCGYTTVCSQRCASAIAAFNAELQRTPLPDAPPSSMQQTVESPLFNVYAPADSSAALTVVAFTTVPVADATDGCRARCGGAGECMALVRSAGALLQLDFFCIPDPSLIAATVFPTTLDSSSLDASDRMQASEGYVFMHVEVLYWKNMQPWVVGYTSRTTSSVALDGAVQVATAHEIWAWRAGARFRVLGTDDLAAESLTVPVQRALFAGQTLLKPQVGVCSISVAVGVPVDADRIAFFLAFTVQVEGVRADDGSTQIGGFTLHALVTWSASAPRVSYYYAPGVQTELDALLDLARAGTFLALGGDDDNTFLAVDSADASRYSSGLYARAVRIAPSRGLVWTDTSTSWRWATSDPDTMALLGTWTRGTVFSLLAPVQPKPIRDGRANRTAGLRWFQVSGVATTSIGAWMHEVRAGAANRGWLLRPFGTQQTGVTAVLTVKCAVQSCMGCATPRLRLLCHQAQDCVLTRCVGSVVQTRNVLCGIGSVLEQTARHALATWSALFDAIVELGLLVLRGRAGTIAQTIALRFPTDQVLRKHVARSRLPGGQVDAHDGLQGPPHHGDVDPEQPERVAARADVQGVHGHVAALIQRRVGGRQPARGKDLRPEAQKVHDLHEVGARLLPSHLVLVGARKQPHRPIIGRPAPQHLVDAQAWRVDHRPGAVPAAAHNVQRLRDDDAQGEHADVHKLHGLIRRRVPREEGPDAHAPHQPYGGVQAHRALPQRAERRRQLRMVLLACACEARAAPKAHQLRAGLAEVEGARGGRRQEVGEEEVAHDGVQHLVREEEARTR